MSQINYCFWRKSSAREKSRVPRRYEYLAIRSGASDSKRYALMSDFSPIEMAGECNRISPSESSEDSLPAISNQIPTFRRATSNRLDRRRKTETQVFIETADVEQQAGHSPRRSSCFHRSTSHKTALLLSLKNQKLAETEHGKAIRLLGVNEDAH
jgi:hypothetical protein